MAKSLLHNYNKILFILFTIVFAVSSVMSGSFAWQSISQKATNTVQGVVVPSNVKLIKLEMLADGTKTDNRLEGAEFCLFKFVKDEETGEVTSEQVGIRHITNINGEIRLTLSAGDYYFKETLPPAGYDYEKDDAGQDVTVHSFHVYGGQPAEIKVYNVLRTGQLAISKIVSNYDLQELSAGQAEREFEFCVEFGQEGEYRYEIPGVSPPGGENIRSGEIIRLQHDQMAVFSGLPVGLQYSVTEIPVPGYMVSSSGASGNITEEGCKAVFVNTYYTGGVTGALNITKTAENADGFPLSVEQSAKEFEFTVTIDGQVLAPVFLKSGQTSQTWVGIPVGTEYVVTEKDYSEEGWLAEVREYRGQITGPETVELEFTNVYNPEPQPGQMGSLVVTKTVSAAEGDAADPDKEFTFEAVIGNKTRTFKLKASGSEFLGSFPVGTKYEIRETDAAFYYPQTSAMSGTIVGGGTVTVEFINKKPHSTEVEQLIVKKIVEGNAPASDLLGKSFEFELYIDKQLWPVSGYLHKADGTGVEITVQQSFFIKDGEWMQINNLPVGASYAVVEKDYFAQGYSASLDNSAGIIHKNPATGPEVVTAVNTYTGREIRHIAGEKIWDWGADYSGSVKPYPESVTVRLKTADGVVVDEQSVKAGDDGRWIFAFRNVARYNDAGEEIIYSVEEDVPKGFSVRYFYDVNGFKITNTYTGRAKFEPVTVDPPVIKKAVSGSDIPETSFGFVMKAQGRTDPDGPASQVPMPEGSEGTRKKVTLTCGGSRTAAAVELGRISYDEEGIYRYKISETKGKAEGWTYDRSEYIFTVVVTADGKGGLTARTSLTRNGQDVQSGLAEFYNSYSGGGGGGYEPPGPPETNIVVSGTKTWVHGSNPKESHPQSVIVKVYGDGKLAAQRAVTAADGWKYSFSLPKYSGGKLITYTVDEDSIAGYSKTVAGYDLVNTFVPPETPGTPDDSDNPDKPGTPGEPDKPEKPGQAEKPGDSEEPEAPDKVPETGPEDLDMLFWLMMMFISGQGMIIMLVRTRIKH